MSSDPLWKHFSPNTAVTFPPLLRQKIRQNIILINFCLTDQSATDSHPLGTLACTDTLLTESGAPGFKLLSRRISGLPGGAGGILRSRPRSPALPGAAACSYPWSPSGWAWGKRATLLDANGRQREVRKHLMSSPSLPLRPRWISGR